MHIMPSTTKFIWLNSSIRTQAFGLFWTERLFISTPFSCKGENNA